MQAVARVGQLRNFSACIQFRVREMKLNGTFLMQTARETNLPQVQRELAAHEQDMALDSVLAVPCGSEYCSIAGVKAQYARREFIAPFAESRRVA